MNGLIYDAINTRHLLRFVYDDHLRIVEPHLYGINSARHDALSAWIVGGWSQSRPEPGWRNYLVAGMHDIEVVAEPFPGPRSGYNPGGAGFRQVYCALKSRAG